MLKYALPVFCMILPAISNLFFDLISSLRRHTTYDVHVICMKQCTLNAFQCVCGKESTGYSGKMFEPTNCYLNRITVGILT